MPSPMNRKMYLGVLPPNRPSSRPFSSAAGALGSAAEAAAAFAATRLATEAAAPAFRKLRRENLKVFIPKFLSLFIVYPLCCAALRQRRGPPCGQFTLARLGRFCCTRPA